MPEETAIPDDDSDQVYHDGHRSVHRVGETTAGGAYAAYECHGDSVHALSLQHDVIPEVGVVGWTNETLAAVIIDRLECFQAGGFPCDENATALKYFQQGLAELEARTSNREKRKVEGKHEA